MVDDFGSIVYRTHAGLHSSELANFCDEDLAAAIPYRRFSWTRGQGNLPGFYWSATVGDHVGYESRLELARLLIADFDCEVTAIISQPFGLLTHRARRQPSVPDYLLLSPKRPPHVVDVKTAIEAQKPDVREQLDTRRRALQGGLGWRYEVWTGDGQERLIQNLRLLSCFRRDWMFTAQTVRAVVSHAHTEGITSLEKIEQNVTREAPAIVRASALHTVWRQLLRPPTLTEPLRSATPLRPGGSTL